MADAVRALSIKSVADKLGVSERYIAALIASGTLPSFKLGRRRLVRETALLAFLEQRETIAW
jgi:excisionase family DNA binding protein